MKKIYKYQGAINQDFISIDVSNIKVFEYIQSVDTNVLSQEEQELLSRLTIAIAMNDAIDTTTFSDSRYCYLFINMMLKNKQRIKVSSIIDFIIYYQYLLSFYNKEIEDIDSMIRFINLYIGYTYHSESVNSEELQELSILAAELSNAINDAKTIIDYTPQFVLEAISMADGITLGEWKDETSKEGVEIVEKPKEEEPTTSAIKFEGEYQEYYDSIESIIMVWDEEEEKHEEWTLVVDTYTTLIKEVYPNFDTKLDESGKPYFVQTMGIGGITQSYVSPALLQFDSGGLVERFSSPLPQTPSFGGEPKMFSDGGKIGFEGLAKRVAAKYQGKKVAAKYQSLYGKKYSKEEAKEVGQKVAAKVYRQQQANK